jgi:hypothetical protein
MQGRTQRYAAYLQYGENSPCPNLSPPKLNSSLALLTDRDLNIHTSVYGGLMSKHQRLEVWLKGVVEAMDNGELEDAMQNSWDLYSDPEKRVVDPRDRPDDEWDNIAWQRNVRRRTQPVYMDVWGNMSER